LDYITEKIRFLTHFASPSKWKRSPSYKHLLPPFGEMKKTTKHVWMVASNWWYIFI
jgi:hypothetical protein